ncbi:MAG TPA: serine/threonine-protein kinase, partial [Streptosporangiaceae bacterium]
MVIHRFAFNISVTGAVEGHMAVERDGRVIAGRYRLTRAIGRGGMGVVWAAADLRLGREVAVKELLVNPGISDDQNTTLLHRALREGRIAAALDHPSVVTVYDTFLFDDRPWIVMELLRGASLAQLVARSGPLTPERAAAVGVPLLGALRAAHTAGIVHRDVKPGNVLLTDDGRVVLTDFGLAAVEGDPSLTQAGMVMGSPPYVAPERARGAPATPAADLWSLGATLFMAVEGKGPYDRETPIAALGALVTEEPPAPTNAGPLRPLIEGLLTRDPLHRLDPETAAELLRRVAESDNSPHALSTPTPAPTATPEAAPPPTPAPADPTPPEPSPARDLLP